MAKPLGRTSIGKFEINREEIITLAKTECSEFRMIPQKYQYALALYACGMTNEAIVKVATVTDESLADAIDKYGKYLTRMPDVAKTKMNRRMLFNAMGMYAAVVSDREKVLEMSPKDALVVLKELPAILDSLIAIEHKMSEADGSAFKDFGDFKKSLTPAEPPRLEGKDVWSKEI